MSIDVVGFLTSSLVVIMTPGPDLALITRLVLNGSARTGVAAAFGMITAGAAQAGLGALGLALLLATRPGLFATFRWIGAGVLLTWAALALRAALRPPAAAPDTTTPLDNPPNDAPPLTEDQAASPKSATFAAAPPNRAHPTRWAYAQGLLCTGSNPKVGMFLMAFLPQFAPRGLDPALGVAILAACYLALGLLWLLTWIRLVHRLARRLQSARVIRLTHWLTAFVFSGFAVRLALGA